MEDNTKIKVKNRSHSPVVYIVPDMGNLRREFQGLEEKTLDFEEVRKLSYLPGGRVLLKEYLIIRNEEALKELNLDVEPEYFYGQAEVEKLLKEGSMDEFLDCLDFAPEGVIDLIKECAITLPLNDVAKREALLNKLGYDVNKIMEVRKATIGDKEEEQKTKSVRRAATSVNSGNEADSNQPKTSRRVIIPS